MCWKGLEGVSLSEGRQISATEAGTKRMYRDPDNNKMFHAAASVCSLHPILSFVVHAFSHGRAVCVPRGLQ